MKLRVGLVGLGDQWESRHAPALRAMPHRFEVAAVCCEVFERARKVADQFDATAAHSFRNLVDRQDIDAILYLSPQWFGPLPILAACENGKAVYTSAALDVTSNWKAPVAVLPPTAAPRKPIRFSPQRKNVSARLAQSDGTGRLVPISGRHGS